jgi:putative transposase
MVYSHNYQNLEEACSSVFEYIEIFYSQVRRHSTNGGIIPVEYENNYYERAA